MRVNFRHLEEDPKGHGEHGEHPLKTQRRTRST